MSEIAGSNPNTYDVTPEFLEHYMDERGFMVIATRSRDPKNAWPDVARHEYGHAVDGSGHILIICDSLDARNTCQNLMHDPHASIEIGSQDDELTLQMYGTARVLEGDELAALQQMYAEKSRRLGRNATAEDFIGRPGVTWFGIDVDFWEFTDVSQQPWLRATSEDRAK